MARDGFVYFLATDDWQYLKIGKATNLEKRVGTLKIQLPFPVTLVHAIATNDTSWLESFFHRAYKMLRRNGEWFHIRNQYTFNAFFGAWLERKYWDEQKQLEFSETCPLEEAI
jgi:hypothetical protein